MTQHYVFAIAGNYTVWRHPQRPGEQQLLPSSVVITQIPEDVWPVWHAAFGREDLTGLWWYADAEIDAAPVVAAAAEHLRAHRGALADAHGPRVVAAQLRIMDQLLVELTKYPDGVVALGREEAPQLGVWTAGAE